MVEPVESEFKILEINTSNKIKKPIALFEKMKLENYMYIKEGLIQHFLKILGTLKVSMLSV